MAQSKWELSASYRTWPMHVKDGLFAITEPDSDVPVLVLVDANTGSVLWKAFTPFEVEFAFSDGDHLVVTDVEPTSARSGSAQLLALDIESGEVLDGPTDLGGIVSAPTTAQPMLITVPGHDLVTMNGVELGDLSRPMWEVPLAGNSPLIAGGYALVGERFIDLSDGRPLGVHQYSRVGFLVDRAVFAIDDSLILCAEGILDRLDPVTGKSMWPDTVDVGACTRGNPHSDVRDPGVLVGKDTLYALSDDSGVLELWAIDLQTGNVSVELDVTPDSYLHGLEDYVFVVSRPDELSDSGGYEVALVLDGGTSLVPIAAFPNAYDSEGVLYGPPAATPYLGVVAVSAASGTTLWTMPNGIAHPLGGRLLGFTPGKDGTMTISGLHSN